MAVKMEGQEGTVVIRVAAGTREQLIRLRQKKHPDSEWSQELETIGGVVKRLATVEEERQAKKPAAGGKVDKQRRSKKGKRAKAKGRRPAKGKRRRRKGR